MAIRGYSGQTELVLFYGGATWGAATAAFEGSNDGTNFIALADGQGGAISKTNWIPSSRLSKTNRFARPRLTTVGTAAQLRSAWSCAVNNPFACKGQHHG